MMRENDHGSWHRINFNCWYKNSDVALSKNKTDEKLIKTLTPKVPTPAPAVIIDDPWQFVVACLFGAKDPDRNSHHFGVFCLHWNWEPSLIWCCDLKISINVNRAIFRLMWNKINYRVRITVVYNQFLHTKHEIMKFNLVFTDIIS